MAEKQNSVDFTSENISFMSSETGGKDIEYPWFTFDIYLPERKLTITKTCPCNILNFPKS